MAIQKDKKNPLPTGSPSHLYSRVIKLITLHFDNQCTFTTHCAAIVSLMGLFHNKSSLGLASEASAHPGSEGVITSSPRIQTHRGHFNSSNITARARITPKTKGSRAGE